MIALTIVISYPQGYPQVIHRSRTVTSSLAICPFFFKINSRTPAVPAVPTHTGAPGGARSTPSAPQAVDNLWITGRRGLGVPRALHRLWITCLVKYAAAKIITLRSVTVRGDGGSTYSEPPIFD